MTRISLFVLVIFVLQFYTIQANIKCEYLKSDFTFGKCAAGRYGDPALTMGICTTDNKCSGPCKAGYYCPEGSSSATQNICPAGSYSQAEAGSCISCPAGETSLPGTTSCGVTCPRGSYCALGSVSTIVVPCPAGRYGKYEGKSDPFETCFPCDAGYYGDKAGLTHSQCSGRCDVTRFCPAGSTNKQGTQACIVGPAKEVCDRDCSCIKNRKQYSYYCPKDAEYGDLTEWSACSRSCNGERYQYRRVTKPDEYNGGEATYKYFEPCNTDKCKCNPQTWKSITDCKATSSIGNALWQSRLLYDPTKSVEGPPCPVGTQTVKSIPC